MPVQTNRLDSPRTRRLPVRTGAGAVVSEGSFAMNELAPIRHFDMADEALLLNTIDRWLEKEVRPVVKEHDHADRWPAELVEKMREFGLFGATVSPEYGGLGLPAVTYARIVMRISSVWMA